MRRSTIRGRACLVQNEVMYHGVLDVQRLARDILDLRNKLRGLELPEFRSVPVLDAATVAVSAFATFVLVP